MSDNEEDPRRPDPQNWWEKLFGWPGRVRFWAFEREEAMWERVQSWPMLARDVLAGAIIAFTISAFTMVVICADKDFKRDAEIVATAPRESATLDAIDYGFRSDDTYYIRLQGEELEVDYGWFIDGPYPGMIVEVVRDPASPAHVIVVGTPQDWADKPWAPVFAWALGLLGTGIVTVFFGVKLVPERADQVFEVTERLGVDGRFVRWVDRTLQRWFGGGAPPSGRHSAQ